MTSLKEIYSEWVSNPKFKEEFNKDPIQAIENAGFHISQRDRKKIIAKIRGENERLEDRVNK